MIKIQLLAVLALIFFAHGLWAQSDCGNRQSFTEWRTQKPDLVNQLYSFSSRDDDNTVYTIPIVVHIVWSNGFENIHDSLIYRQIEELNRFYSGNTSRSINVAFAFKDLNAGDTKIRFEFAKTDPEGFPTNGITRTQTAHGVFNDNGGPCSVNDVKKSALGGRDAWDTDKYLNIWVCDFDNTLNGIAVFPGNCPAAEGQDGVIVDYTLFGIVPTSLTGSGISTLAHEAGHYLGLFHTWGDEPDAEQPSCSGDDNLSDTPLQSGKGFTISPSGNTFFPLFDNCSTPLISKGIMFMNIMDTNYDLSRYMFTNNQKAVIRNTLKPGGPRNSLVDASNNALTPSGFNVDATFKVWNTLNTTVFPSNSFRSVVRGKNGEMWAGTTNNGLYRYNDSNGTWEQEPTLTSHLVRHMVSDKNGNVFVASSQLTSSNGGGVRRFGSANSFSFTKIGSIVDGSGFNQLPSRLVNSVCIDDEGDIWAVCGQHINADASINEGGFLYADNNILLFADGHYAGNSGLPSEDVRCLAIGSVLDGPTDNDDEIWVSVDRSCISGNCSAPYVARYNTTLGIIEYLGNVGLPGLNFDNTTGSPRVRAIHCDKSGRVWLGIATSQQGIYVKFPSSMGNANLFTFGDASLPYPAGANVNNNAIAEDSDGNIWIGTTAGLIKIDGGNIQNAARWTIYTTAQGLPSNNIRGICFDANNTMWCTTDAGIFRGLPCPVVRIKNVTNAPCLGTGFIETTSKGGDFSNTTYTWFKVNSTNVYDPYPLVDPSVTANTPGTYKLIVSSGGQQCFNRKIQVAANNLFVPELSISKLTACGFDIDLQNETNSVFYNIDVKDATTNNVVYTQFLTGNGNTSISDNSLFPLTSYYVDVTGTCTEDPTGTFQTIARRSRIFTTPLCSPVKNIIASNITKTSAQLDWEFNCTPASKYRIQYKRIADTSFNNTIQSLTPSKNLTNLEPSTTYVYQIRSVCDPSLSAWCGDTLTTQQGCARPQNINISATTPTTATITWEAVTDVSKYRLRFRKLATTAWTSLVIPSTSTSRTITGLTPNTAYEFQMRTQCVTNNEFSLYTTTNGFLTSARIAEDELLHDITLFPNPSSGSFTLSLFSELETAVSIKIINALGQELVVKSILLEGGNNTLTFSEILPNGYYNVQLQNDLVQINKGLIIQK
jgi:hypothetical protein